MAARHIGQLVFGWGETITVPFGLTADYDPESGLNVSLPRRRVDVDTQAEMTDVSLSDFQVRLPGLDVASLRLLNAFIAAETPHVASREPSLFSGLDHILLTADDVEAALIHCVDEGLLEFDDDGGARLASVPDPGSVTVAIEVRDGHARWGHVFVAEVCVDAALYTPTLGARSRLGEWMQSSDYWVYRVALPATAFATTTRHRVSQVVALAIQDIIDAVNASWRGR
jgi:hypothetical protein